MMKNALILILLYFFFFFLVYYEIGDLLNFLAHIKISLEIANINVYLYKPKNHLKKKKTHCGKDHSKIKIFLILSINK